MCRHFIIFSAFLLLQPATLAEAQSTFASEQLSFVLRVGFADGFEKGWNLMDGLQEKKRQRKRQKEMLKLERERLKQQNDLANQKLEIERQRLELDRQRLLFQQQTPIENKPLQETRGKNDESRLMKCPTDQTQRYDNCFGTYTSGNGKYVGEWRDDKYHGQGTYKYPNGHKYVGEFRDNKRHGQGIYYAADGSILNHGTYKNDRYSP